SIPIKERKLTGTALPTTRSRTSATSFRSSACPGPEPLPPPTRVASRTYHWPCRPLREEEQVFRRAALWSGGERGPRERHRHGGNMDTAGETAGHLGASLGKPEFFGGDMYMFQVTG